MRIDFPKLLTELKAAGLSDEIVCSSIGRAESNYLWRLKSGAIANPSFETGQLLVQLYQKHCGDQLPYIKSRKKKTKAA